jgi:hypothetical protein
MQREQEEDLEKMRWLVKLPASTEPGYLQLHPIAIVSSVSVSSSTPFFERDRKDAKR